METKTFTVQKLTVVSSQKNKEIVDILFEALQKVQSIKGTEASIVIEEVTEKKL